MEVNLATDLLGTLDPVTRLGDASRPPADAELEAVGTQFESVFMSLMISEMREATETGMFEGEGSDTFGGLFDMFMGQHLAQAGGIGIKQMLIQRYAANAANAPEAT